MLAIKYNKTAYNYLISLDITRTIYRINFTDTQRYIYWSN